MSITTRHAAAIFLTLPLCALAAGPVTVSWSSANTALVTTPDAIQQTAAGVTITARGYVAEFDDVDPSHSDIIGPFSTAVLGNHQIFGPGTASATDPSSFGLGLFVAASPGVAPSGVDYGGQAYAAGLDSGACCFGAYLGDNPDVPGPPRQQKTDFVLVSFSTAVNVSQFGTNTANAWWAAGWTSAPDLAVGLNGALASATVIQARGTQIDPFVHDLQGFDGIQFLAIGYSPRVPGYAALGEYNPGEFFLNRITLTPVPEPGTWLLLAAGLAAVAGRKRRA